jgi:hypothetical protein
MRQTVPSCVVLLFLGSLAGCGYSGPPCAFLELDGETSGGGGVLLEEPLDSGESANRVIAVSVLEVPNSPAEGFLANYTIDCDDEGCPVEIDCTPDIITAGQSMFCDVLDATEEGTDACSWSCRIAFDVSHEDASVCSPARSNYELVGRHEPES